MHQSPLKYLSLMLHELKHRKHIFNSYAQDGEDMLIREYFSKKRNGFYIDIGAYHPIKFSNTYYFYKKGWRGINIDATPGSMAEFNKIRPFDINIETPVDHEEKNVNYYCFQESAFNTFNEDLAQQRIQGGIILQESLILKTSTLNHILATHLPTGQNIDFISLDVEGSESGVLRSFDLKKFRPTIIIVEILNFNFNDFNNHNISSLLKSHGYTVFASTQRSLIFINKNNV